MLWKHRFKKSRPEEIERGWLYLDAALSSLHLRSCSRLADKVFAFRASLARLSIDHKEPAIVKSANLLAPNRALFTLIAPHNFAWTREVGGGGGLALSPLSGLTTVVPWETSDPILDFFALTCKLSATTVNSIQLHHLPESEQIELFVATPAWNLPPNECKRMTC